MIFEAERIFTVDQNGNMLTRRAKVEISPGEYVGRNVGPDSPLRVTGIQSQDFALFAKVIDEDGADKVGYLVTRYFDEKNAFIVPGDLVEKYPKMYLTPELTDRIHRLSYDAMDEFSLRALKDYVKKYFPR